MNPNQNAGPQWEQVAGGGSNNQRWEPTKMNFDQNNPPFLCGYFKDLVERNGPKGIFRVAEVTTVNPDGSLGETFDVAGGQVLDGMLDKIDLGSFIGIKFTGKARSKTGNTYNTWETFIDKNAIPYSQLGGKVVIKTAPVNTPPVQQQQQNAPVFNPNQGFQQNNQPVFNQNQNQANTNQAPFNSQSQMNSAPPVFNNPGQQNNQPAVNQQPYVPPVQQNTFTPPVNTPPVQQQQQNNTPGTFGGQPLPPNPFVSNDPPF